MNPDPSQFGKRVQTLFGMAGRVIAVMGRHLISTDEGSGISETTQNVDGKTSASAFQLALLARGCGPGVGLLGVVVLLGVTLWL